MDFAYIDFKDCEKEIRIGRRYWLHLLYDNIKAICRKTHDENILQIAI